MPKWMSALQFLGVGVYIAASILLGVYVGRLLDGRFGTGALFTLLGLVLGLVVAAFGLYRMLVAFIKQNENGKKEDKPR